MKIWYGNAEYLNDFGVSDTSLYAQDFVVTDPNDLDLERFHGNIDNWASNDTLDLLMRPHEGVLYPPTPQHPNADNRGYNRDPKVWTRTDNNQYTISDQSADDYWENATIDTASLAYTFTANFYRLVDNEFKLMQLLPGFMGGTESQIFVGDHIDDFIVDGQASEYEYGVYQRRNGPEQQYLFEVSAPLIIGSGDETKYFFAWSPQDGDIGGNTTYDTQTMIATTTINPDLHHVSTYQNEYKGYYGQFKAWAFEYGYNPDDPVEDITDEVGLAVGAFDAASKSWRVTVPIDYTDAQTGTVYKFVGWWDGNPGQDLGNGYVQRDFAVNGPQIWAYKYSTVAMYKVHMHSIGSAIPTSWPNQRKVVVDDDNYYHTVYESGNRVWYVKSNSGANWSPEVPINEWNTTAAHPAIATMYQFPYYRYITYVDMTSSEVVVKFYDETFGPSEVYRSAPVADKNVCYPAIACSMNQDDPTWMVVWNDGSELKFTVQKSYHDFDANGATLVQGQAGNPVFPSIAVVPQYDPDPTGNTFHVSWREESDVLFAELKTRENPSYDDIDPLTWVAGQGLTNMPEIVHSRTGTPSGIALPAKNAPCITSDNAPVTGTSLYADYAFVAYEMDNNWSAWPAASSTVSPLGLVSKSPRAVRGTSMPSTSFSNRFTVMEREFKFNIPSGYSWANTNIGYTTYSYNNFPLRPSVMSKYSAIGGTGTGEKRHEVRVSYQQYQDAIYVRRYLYQPTFQAGDAVGPNTVPWVDFGIIPLEVYSEYAGGIFNYSIASTSTGLYKTTSISTIEMREMFVQKDSAVAVFGICNPRWSDASENIGAIAWNPMKDSIGTDWYYPIVLRMRTATFNTSNVDSLHYERELYSINGQDFDSEYFVLSIHDAEDDEVLMQEALFMGDLPSDSSLYELTGMDISALRDRDVYITFGVSSEVDTSMVQIIHFQGIVDEDTASAKANSMLIPSNITLTNFPNPFNPSTDITYGIPEETHVKLSVYDNLGREVKVLANGWKAAGTYTITFDAADLPSGMYLYRIETEKGSVSKKMMLMK